MTPLEKQTIAHLVKLNDALKESYGKMYAFAYATIKEEAKDNPQGRNMTDTLFELKLVSSKISDDIETWLKSLQSDEK